MSLKFRMLANFHFHKYVLYMYVKIYCKAIHTISMGVCNLDKQKKKFKTFQTETVCQVWHNVKYIHTNLSKSFSLLALMFNAGCNS